MTRVEDCPDPDMCDDPAHTDGCPDCGAWVHRGEPWLAHRIEHEETS